MWTDIVNGDLTAIATVNDSHVYVGWINVQNKFWNSEVIYFHQKI